MTIKEKEQALIVQFCALNDWMDRYQLLIEFGKNCPPISDNDKTDLFLIKGCQSRVWLKAEEKDGSVFFQADSDAVITKGIVSILIHVFSGATPKEILDDDMSFLEKIGLKEHLSPTRSNGLSSMIKQIKLYALALSIKKS